MNVLEIVTEALKKMGADGLCNDEMECACGIGDLFWSAGSCQGVQSDCRPAKRGTDEEAAEQDLDEIYYPMEEAPVCPTCGDKGKVDVAQGEVSRIIGQLPVPCPDCGGEGVPDADGNKKGELP